MAFPILPPAPIPPWQKMAMFFLTRPTETSIRGKIHTPLISQSWRYDWFCFAFCFCSRLIVSWRVSSRLLVSWCAGSSRLVPRPNLIPYAMRWELLEFLLQRISLSRSQDKEKELRTWEDGHGKTDQQKAHSISNNQQNGRYWCLAENDGNEVPWFLTMPQEFNDCSKKRSGLCEKFSLVRQFVESAVCFIKFSMIHIGLDGILWEDWGCWR